MICVSKQRHPVSSCVLAVICLVGSFGCASGMSPAPVAAPAAPTPAPAPPAITVTITGAAQVRLGETVQLSANVANSLDNSVMWQVNGVAGGSAATGTITAGGLYTPPATLPTPNTVTIKAISHAVPAVSGTLAEAVLNPVPVVTSASASGLGPSYLVDVVGTGFVKGSQVQVAGSSLTTTFVTATELQAMATLPAGSTTATVDVVNPDPGGTSSPQVMAQVTTLKTTVSQAARLLDQTTFGPTLSDIQHVQAVGLNAYVTEQFNLPPTTLPAISNPAPLLCTNGTIPCLQNEWWQATLTAPDQLRQRVAFALAEMFVISSDSVNPRSITPFQNVLVNDAFGNFYTVMHDVTLSTGMGAYLNMLHSNKPGVVNGVKQIANENYSRELMQLFTIGLIELNADGTPKLDGAGNTIPSYTEVQVEAFARAYTGWTYATAMGGVPTNFPNYAANYDLPMVAVASAHDVAAKMLLNGTTLPAGQTAQADLSGALQNLFNHPNVGPFVCRQLIQHLVASSPSPAYLARVSAVFADSGRGVRGDMKAVISAILNDVDARAGDTSPSFDGGHLREPVLWLADVMRGLGYTNTDANGYYFYLGNYTSNLNEKPYESHSVFNFFPPEYVIPGTTANAPEFGLENTASAVQRLSLADQLVYNRIAGFTVDLSKTSALGIMASKTGNAVTDSGNLVDALGTIFLHGQMPAPMKTAIVNNISVLTDPAQRVRVATYLVITSPVYLIEH